VYRNRVVITGAILAFTAACSPGADKDKTEPPPVNPTPTARGQVVVLGGNGQLAGEPKAGGYAVQTPMVPVGPVTAAPDGSVYVPVRGANQDDTLAQVVHIGQDGKLQLVGPKLKWVLNDKLSVRGNELWVLSSAGAQQNLRKFSLTGQLKDIYFDARSDRDLIFTDPEGQAVDGSLQEKARTNWRTLAQDVAVALGFLADGTPVIALRSGQLYEALGHGKVRPWEPLGYSAARKALTDATGQTESTRSAFLPGALVQDAAGGMFMASNSGVIHLPKAGAAISIRLPSRFDGIPWAGGAVLADGSLALASRFDYPGRATLIRIEGATGKAIEIDSKQHCGREKTPAFSGLTQRSDGVTVIADKGCGRIYGAQLS
jgi:hypothetical protein